MVTSFEVPLPNTSFPASVYSDALERIREQTRRHMTERYGPDDDMPSLSPSQIEAEMDSVLQEDEFGYFVVTTPEGEWQLGSVAEVLERMKAPFSGAVFDISLDSLREAPSLRINVDGTLTRVSVSVGSSEESLIKDWSDWWKTRASEFPAPPPAPQRPRVFIGHGGSPMWREIVQFLQSLDVEVQAYESLPHQGRTMEKVLTGALNWANVALLVMTAEDQMADESLQARQNVVHEIGLFQGRLGWDNAIVLLEEGANEFSNIAGTNQLRFLKGQIAGTFGDITIALRDRFPGLR